MRELFIPNPSVVSIIIYPVNDNSILYLIIKKPAKPT